MRKNIVSLFIILFVVASLVVAMPVGAQTKCTSGQYISSCGKCVLSGRVDSEPTSCILPDGVTLSGGKWSCGDCVCPTGRTQRGNSCVDNCLSDQVYSSTESICKKATIISPAAPQPGVVDIGYKDATDFIVRSKLDHGNLTLKGNPSNTGEGNIYLDSGKAIQVNATGTTELNVGNYTSGLFNMNVNGNMRWTGTLTNGTVPWARLGSFPLSCPAGQFINGVGSTLSCGTPLTIGEATTYGVGDNIIFNEDVSPITIGVAPAPTFDALAVRGDLNAKKGTFIGNVSGNNHQH